VLTAVLGIALVIGALASFALAVAGIISWWSGRSHEEAAAPPEPLLCPACGADQGRVDRSRVDYLSCPACSYVILNRGGETGPAPGWVTRAAAPPTTAHAVLCFARARACLVERLDVYAAILAANGSHQATREALGFFAAAADVDTHSYLAVARWHEAPERTHAEILAALDTGGADFILRAGEREAEPPTPGFLRSLLRAGARPSAEAATATGAAPRVVVTRPYLSKKRVGLGCGHAFTSLAKVRPHPGDRVPCQGCLDGDPTDSEMVEAAIADATPDQIEMYAALVAARRVA
jgi:hypothetical protein